MLVKILEDRTPEDRCSVCGSDKSVKYYFIDKEGNRRLLCNKCALTYNSIVGSAKESYIVTMTDYRSANAAYIQSEDMRKALIKEDMYVGSYPDIETATISIYKKIETLFDNINLPYKINIEVCVYPDKNQKMFYVSSKGQIQVIFKIERENMFIDRFMINSVYGATGAEQSISAGSCYISNNGSNGSIRIDYVYLDTNKHAIGELFKVDGYTLLYNINEYADIFTHFYDLRDRKKTKDTLTIVLTGRFPERDSYDPFNTSYIDAYVGEGDPSNNMLNYIKIYNGKYELGDEKFIKRIMDEMQSISIPIDNVYIIDKRLLPEEKEDKSSTSAVRVDYDFGDNKVDKRYYYTSEVDEEKKEYEKAIECTIRISDDYNNDSTLMIFKFKTDGNCNIKSLSKVAINTEDFIRYLKQYTDGHTKFIDERVGPSWIAFYSRISYECHIIEMDADNITLKHYDQSNGTISSNYKTERKCFEEVLDQIKDANIIYIRDETAWSRVERPNSSSTDVDDSYIATCAQIDSDYNSLLGL